MKCFDCGKPVYDKITNGLCWNCVGNWKTKLFGTEAKNEMPSLRMEKP